MDTHTEVPGDDDGAHSTDPIAPTLAAEYQAAKERIKEHFKIADGLPPTPTPTTASTPSTAPSPYVSDEMCHKAVTLRTALMRMATEAEEAAQEGAQPFYERVAPYGRTHGRVKTTDKMPIGELAAYCSLAHTVCPTPSFVAWGAATRGTGVLTTEILDGAVAAGHWNSAPNVAMVAALNDALPAGGLVVITGAATGGGLEDLRSSIDASLYDVAVPAGAEDMVKHHDGTGAYAVTPGTAAAAGGASCWHHPAAAVATLGALVAATRPGGLVLMTGLVVGPDARGLAAAAAALTELLATGVLADVRDHTVTPRAPGAKPVRVLMATLVPMAAPDTADAAPDVTTALTQGGDGEDALGEGEGTGDGAALDDACSVGGGRGGEIGSFGGGCGDGDWLDGGDGGHGGPGGAGEGSGAATTTQASPLEPLKILTLRPVSDGANSGVQVSTHYEDSNFKNAVVYMLVVPSTEGGFAYVGATSDWPARLTQHVTGRGCLRLYELVKHLTTVEARLELVTAHVLFDMASDFVSLPTLRRQRLRHPDVAPLRRRDPFHPSPFRGQGSGRTRLRAPRGTAPQPPHGRLRALGDGLRLYRRCGIAHTPPLALTPSPRAGSGPR